MESGTDSAGGGGGGGGGVAVADIRARARRGSVDIVAKRYIFVQEGTTVTCNRKGRQHDNRLEKRIE